MTMDIGHLRGFLFSVVKTSVLTAYLYHALASCGMCGPHPANDEKRHHRYKQKKAYTEESEFVDG